MSGRARAVSSAERARAALELAPRARPRVARASRGGLADRSSHPTLQQDVCRTRRWRPEHGLWSSARVRPTRHRPAARARPARPRARAAAAVRARRRAGGGAARGVRLRRLPAGPARGGRGRRRRARRAGRDADRLGQVALLPAAGADARRPDAGRLAARVADAGPGRGARARRARQGGARQRAAGRGGQPRGGRPRGVRARAAALRRARAVLLAGVPGADPAARRSGCSSSTRRTASRSGATTSGRTTSGSPTRRAGSAPRRSSRRPRPRRRRWRTTSSRGSACATRCAIATGFDRPNLSFAVVPCATKEAGHRGIAAALARAGRAAGDRLRGHARGVRQALGAARRRSSARRCSPTTPGCRARRAPRRSGASWTARSTSSWRRTRSGWASTRPTCGRSATRRCPGSIEAYYQEAGPRGARRQAGALPAVRVGARQGPARVLHRALDGRGAGAQGGRARADGVGRRPSGRWPAARRRVRRAGRALARLAGCDEEVVRAIVGHLARVGVIQPSPSSPDRVARPRDRGLGRPRARAVPVGRAGGHARALAPVPRGLVVGRGLGVPARGASCATSATARRRRRTGPCCDVCDPSLLPPPPAPVAPRAGGGPRQLAQRPVAAGDIGGARRGDRRGRRARAAGARADARGRGAARRPLEGAAQARLGRAAALRHLRPPERPVGARARRRAARRPAR